MKWVTFLLRLLFRTKLLSQLFFNLFLYLGIHYNLRVIVKIGILTEWTILWMQSDGSFAVRAFVNIHIVLFHFLFEFKQLPCNTIFCRLRSLLITHLIFWFFHFLTSLIVTFHSYIFLFILLHFKLFVIEILLILKIFCLKF